MSRLFVPQLKTFPSRESMMRQTSREPEGTMLYVTATASLYLKVPQGWKEIQVLSLPNSDYDTLEPSRLNPLLSRSSATRSTSPATWFRKTR